MRNRGADCWYECGEKDGACPDFCGADGLCCHKGWPYNGCDGTLGGESLHICVEKPKAQTRSDTTRTTEAPKQETELKLSDFDLFNAHRNLVKDPPESKSDEFPTTLADTKEMMNQGEKDLAANEMGGPPPDSTAHGEIKETTNQGVKDLGANEMGGSPLDSTPGDEIKEDENQAVVDSKDSQNNQGSSGVKIMQHAFRTLQKKGKNSKTQ